MSGHTRSANMWSESQGVEGGVASPGGVQVGCPREPHSFQQVGMSRLVLSTEIQATHGQDQLRHRPPQHGQVCILGEACFENRADNGNNLSVSDKELQTLKLGS